jgi:hypothetical protein
VRPEVVQGRVRRLCGAATPGGELSDVVEEDRTLQRVELRGIRCDLGQERIGHQHGSLVRMTAVGVAQQGRDVDVESSCEAVERRQCGHGLAVLDLRDVGARHVHAGGELALGEVADVAKIADGGCNLDSLDGFDGWGNKGEWRRRGGWLLDFQGVLAAAAGCGRGAELHQFAVATFQNFTFCCGVHYLAWSQGSHHGCHKLCIAEAGPERGPQRECPIMVHLR